MSRHDNGESESDVSFFGAFRDLNLGGNAQQGGSLGGPYPTAAVNWLNPRRLTKTRGEVR